MSNYELIPDVYRIQSGVGGDGDIFGGIFLDDDPGLLIGASGGLDFVREFATLLDELNFGKKIRIYYPVVTYNELYTAAFIQKKFPDITFYVHKNNYQAFKAPEDNFLADRYVGSSKTLDSINKMLPRSINNVIAIDKTASFETNKTKLLIVPYTGPQSGHTFIYSRNHKLLFTGVMLGRTSSERSYYIDMTGSFNKYESGLSFLEKAKSEVIAPTYDEPEFTNNLSYKVSNVRDAFKDDRKNILETCSLQPKSLVQIYREYRQYYGENYVTKPYDTIDLNLTMVKMQLDWLIEQGKLIKSDGKYRIK